MEPLSGEKKSAIVRGYLSGMSYEDIAAQNGVSKTTVFNTIADLKAGRFPEPANLAQDVAAFRELAVNLKRLNLTLGQAATGIALLTRILQLGADPADFDLWTRIFKSAGTEDEVRQLLQIVRDVGAALKRTDMSLEELWDEESELDKKVAKLKPLAKLFEDNRVKVIALTKQRDNLASEVTGLEKKHILLNSQVQDTEKREGELSLRTKGMETLLKNNETAIATLEKEKQKLREVGLDPAGLAEFSRAVQVIAQRHHVPPAELKHRLLTELGGLEQGLRLEESIQTKRAEVQKEDQALNATKELREKLEVVVAGLCRQQANLDANIKATTETVATEMSALVPLARDTINGFAVELHQSYKDTLLEMAEQKNKAVELGKTMGYVQGIIDANVWLTGLIALDKREEGFDAGHARAVVLRVLRGAAAWFERYKSNDFRISTLLTATENLIRDLERWQI